MRANNNLVTNFGHLRFASMKAVFIGLKPFVGKNTGRIDMNKALFLLDNWRREEGLGACATLSWHRPNKVIEVNLLNY